MKNYLKKKIFKNLVDIFVSNAKNRLYQASNNKSNDFRRDTTKKNKKYRILVLVVLVFVYGQVI